MAAAARVMGVAGALYHANTRTSSFLLKPFSITHKAIRLNCNLNAAPRRLFACRAQYEPEYQIQVEGEPGTVDSRVFFRWPIWEKGFHRLLYSHPFNILVLVYGSQTICVLNYFKFWISLNDFVRGCFSKLKSYANITSSVDDLVVDDLNSNGHIKIIQVNPFVFVIH